MGDGLEGRELIFGNWAVRPDVPGQFVAVYIPTSGAVDEVRVRITLQDESSAFDTLGGEGLPPDLTSELLEVMGALIVTRDYSQG